MARLILVRHGLTDHNSSHKFLGHTDIDLSAEGFRQVEKLRGRLAEEKIDAVYSSDLKRAMSSAEAVCKGRGAEIICCPELREINYGDCESLTFGEIRQRYPELAETINKLTPDLSFPGGESWQGFIDRTLTFLDRLKQHKPEQRILIVAHGGPMRTLLCNLLGVGQSHWRTFRLDNASLSIVDTYPQRAILSLLNDTSHLNEGPSRGE
ncbi:MAG: histidine phosphatase family protein [Chloroflexi bacterium]|nr:histidine phosphatase family protein [Chloroflexota bacterium]